MSCSYEAFEPAEARRLAQRFETHHTPKHGSWLNVSEIVLSATSIEFLDRRIGSITLLRGILAAWQASRAGGKVTWRFTTADARINLHWLYPSIR